MSDSTLDSFIRGRQRLLHGPGDVGGRPVDHRADLWSLGALMYRLLTGVLVVDSDDEDEPIEVAPPQHPITAHGPDCLTLAPGEVASIYFHAFETDAAETRPIAPACPRSSSASPATGASPRAAPGPAAPQFGPNHARLGGPALLEQALCEFLKELNESGTALR